MNIECSVTKSVINRSPFSKSGWLRVSKVEPRDVHDNARLN